MNDATAAPKNRAVTKELLLEIAAAFNSRNVDRIMSYFAEDATFYMASGPEPVGRAVRGKAAIGKVLADRFKVIPDMRWDHHYEYVCGNRAVSVWQVRGKSKDGTVLNYQGCDLWEFKDGLVYNKDTYWKIVRPD
jgi:ketosteroid isomerase-like protein